MPLAALVGALYFIVSGGPYGLEELAQKVGFGEGIGVLVAVPLAWSLPTALMVGELAAAIPEEGGYFAWVTRALGPFWGFQEAWLSLAASVFDIAIYPTLFVMYLTRLAPSVSPWALPVGVLVIAAGAAWNLAGAWAVGEGSAIMTALLLGPFAVLSVAAFVVHPAAATAVASPPAPHDLAGGVLVAMWNYMGWDNASTIAGEVDRPQRNYPLGVLVALVLVALAYIVPFVAMLVAGVDPSAWETGAWVDAARTYGGQSLAVALVVGGMISAFGMFNALCLSYSRLPAVLSEEGYLPPILSKRLPRTGVPWASVIACSVAWTLSLGLSFERLVSMDILLYGTSLILEFVALVVLRIREPQLPRPFKVPGGTPAAIALGIGPVVLLGVALSKNADEELAGINALFFGLGIVAAGVVVYPLARAYARRRHAVGHVATR